MQNDPYEITTDTSRLDLEVIHGFLAQSYWSPGIDKAVVKKAIAHSLCFGVIHQNKQVGFARVVTDRATFAYLADVFILEAHRGKGLSHRLLDTILRHPEIQGLRRTMLATWDAHSLYERHGFTGLSRPDRFMEIYRPL